MFPSPTVVGDQVLIASCAGRFYSLDRVTGDVQWTFSIRDAGGSQFHCEMVVLDDRVVFGTDGRRGNAHALDLETGRELWMYPCGKALRVDPIVYGDTIIGLARKETNELFCLRVDDGSVVWTVEHERRGRSGHTNAPVLVHDRLYYGATDGRVIAYDPATGAVLDEYDVGEAVSTPLLSVGTFLYGGTASGRVFRLDLETETIDATFETEMEVTGRPARVGTGIGLLLDWRSRDSRLIVLDAELTRERWSWTPSDRENYGTIARLRQYEDVLLLGTQGGDVEARDVTDGSVHWSVTVSGAVRSATVHDDVLYVGTIPGMVHALNMLPDAVAEESGQSDDLP